MNVINGAGYMGHGIYMYITSVDAQYDRKEYYEPLKSVEYVYKIGKIQSMKNYSDMAYNIMENDRVNEMAKLRETQEKYVKIQANAQIAHKKVMNELLTKVKRLRTNEVKKETSCVLS